jgi:hypothetical protein
MRPIPAIAHIDLVVTVDHDRMRGVEFSGPGAVGAPRLHPVAVLVVLGHPRVDVAVADIDVAVRVECHIGRLAEQAVHVWQRRIDVFPRFGLFRGFFPAPEHPDDAARLIEL